MTFIALLALLTSTAHADVSIGVGISAEHDLVDQAFPEERASWGLAPALRIPVRISLFDREGYARAVSLRVSPRLATAKGYDTLVWDDYGGAVTYVSNDHATVVRQAGLDLGPEVALGAGDARVRPYFGLDVGAAWFSHSHDLTGAAAEALGGSASGTTLGTSQVAPHAGAHLGVRFNVSSSFALEAEAGYNVSFLNEVALTGAPDRLGAVRAAYGWNAVSGGLGASFAFGDGTDR